MEESKKLESQGKSIGQKGTESYIHRPMSAETFLSTSDDLDEGILLLVDRKNSSSKSLHVAKHPCDCSAQWFDLPTAMVERLQVIGVETCCGKVYHEILVVLKQDYTSILPLIHNYSTREGPSRIRPSMRIDTSILTPVTSEVQPSDLRLSTVTLRWPDRDPHGRWTENGDHEGSTAWCNDLGDWGIEATMSNHSIWCHHYAFSYEFGSMQPNHPETFVPYFRGDTNYIELCGHHAKGTAFGNGSREERIRANFATLNAARRIMHEH